MLKQHILIVAPSWVGDMVMAQSLFFELKAQSKHCKIDVIAPPWSLAVAEKMLEVNAIIELPIGHGEFSGYQRYQIGKQLRDRCYTRAIVLPNSWKSALIPYFARIPLRSGYVGECRWGLLNDARKLDKTSLVRTVDRFVALAHENPVSHISKIQSPELHADKHNARQVLQKHDRRKITKPVLAICPGAEYGSAKQWPESHYADLAQHYFSKGWKIWLFGSAKDQSVCHKINELTKTQCIDFSGQTTISEAIDLLSLSDAVVSNDSGLMHVAAALNKPLVALYGPSDPEATPPLGASSTTLSLSFSCSPCFQRECPYGHRNCLAQMEPNVVIDQIDNVCGF